MNIRRGFNRLFVVLWLGWVIFLMGWAWTEINRQRSFWDRQIFEGKHGQTWNPSYRATTAELTEWAAHRDQATLRNMVLEVVSSWEALAVLIGLVVVLPAALYGLVFGVGSVIGWVYRGFSA